MVLFLFEVIVGVGGGGGVEGVDEDVFIVCGGWVGWGRIDSFGSL